MVKVLKLQALLALAILCLTGCDGELLYSDDPDIPLYELRVIRSGTGLKLQSYVSGFADDVNAAGLTGNASLVYDGERLVISTGADGSSANDEGTGSDPSNVAGQNGVDLPDRAGEIIKANGTGLSIEMMVKIPAGRIPGGEYWQDGEGNGSACANPLFTMSDGTSWADRTTWFRIFNAQWWFYKNQWAQNTLLPAGGVIGLDENQWAEGLANNQYRHIMLTIDSFGNAQMFIDGVPVISGNLMGTGPAPVTKTDVFDFSQWGNIRVWLGKTNLVNRSTCQMYIYNFAVFGGVLSPGEIAARTSILAKPGAFTINDIH